MNEIKMNDIYKKKYIDIVKVEALIMKVGESNRKKENGRSNKKEKRLEIFIKLKILKKKEIAEKRKILRKKGK